MQKKISLRLSPADANDDAAIKISIAQNAGLKEAAITGYFINKRSIDARGRTVWINLTVTAFINEPFHGREQASFNFPSIANAPKSVIIIGAGPAGLFAALYLIEQGIKPILLERGKEVRARRRDLAALNKEGVVNPESNYCFGEGGAGTYSDGKLYTRSNKRGDIDRILQLFVHFGAEEKIIYEAHPHIGTNKLPQIITEMRKRILDCGGEFIFEKKVTDITIGTDKVSSVTTSDGDTFKADAYILATGHSARDIFELLYRKKISIEAKPFAIGVRIEHPQSLIDSIQYHNPVREDALPPASYSLVQQVEDHGVFSFCMCPGGIIAPAATSPGELVVNGWSPSKRNNPFANSGMVVQVELEDAYQWMKSNHLNPAADDPLLLMHFQQQVERSCFDAGGGKLVAPAQRMADFSNKKTSHSLPGCSYLPGLHSVPLNNILPGFVYNALAKGFVGFGKKLKGYYTNEAVVVATESRTSSPVRIPRDAVSLTHPQLDNFYPCGEGAGYAGGIVSACMDGERVAAAIVMKLSEL